MSEMGFFWSVAAISVILLAIVFELSHIASELFDIRTAIKEKK